MIKGGKAPSLADLKIRIFADGADRRDILEMYAQPFIAGFTTNPTLMRKAGIRDYKAFALDLLDAIPDRPICFEVFSDDMREMERQAETIASWGENVYVKIPVTNTRGANTCDLIGRLTSHGVKVNVTAVMTLQQVKDVAPCLSYGAASYLSIFAGRIADTGRDPAPIMKEAVRLLSKTAPNTELIWASPRELLNLFHADAVGCHIITVTRGILDKLPLLGKDLGEVSLETVKMFSDDAEKAGYSLSESDKLGLGSAYERVVSVR